MSRTASIASPRLSTISPKFYWTHMRREEEQLLPVALQSLTTDDWERVERAFSADEDPWSVILQQNTAGFTIELPK
jgi:hypothetical protein